MSSYIVFTALLLCYDPLHYITPLFTSPVWVLSMDMSRSFYYKYKHRIYCGGRRTKVILSLSPHTSVSISTYHRLCLRLPPPLPPLTAASASAYRRLCLRTFPSMFRKHLLIENNLNILYHFDDKVWHVKVVTTKVHISVWSVTLPKWVQFTNLKFIKIFAKPRCLVGNNDSFHYFVTSFACSSSLLVIHDEILQMLNSVWSVTCDWTYGWNGTVLTHTESSGNSNTTRLTSVRIQMTELCNYTMEYKRCIQ
jgi:hypothetical protein